MSDRGRLAYQTIEAFGWDIIWKHDKPVPDDAWPIDIINRHIAEAVAAEREHWFEAALSDLIAEYADMRKTYEAALSDLIAEYADYDRAAIVDALENQLMAVREADGDDT